MRNIRGFRIGKRLVGISRWIFRQNRSSSSYNRLYSPGQTCRPKPFAKLINWYRRFTTEAKSLCSGIPRLDYIPVGEEPIPENSLTVPKGHLAIYVGQKDGDFQRVLVPVIYINHPLFGELLRGAEDEYGFNQQGGITIPCRYSDFERVQTRISAGSGRRKLAWKPNHN